MTRELPNGYGALVTLIFQEEPWQKDAACRGVVEADGNYDAFWMDAAGRNSGVTRTKYELCADCPVAFECFEYADRIDAQGGIWGGMDPEPRRHMINRFGTAAKARDAHAALIRKLRATKERKVQVLNAKQRYREKLERGA